MGDQMTVTITTAEYRGLMQKAMALDTIRMHIMDEIEHGDHLYSAVDQHFVMLMTNTLDLYRDKMEKEAEK